MSSITRFTISEASACTANLGEYEHYKSNASLLHLTCQSEDTDERVTILRALVTEFGPRSRNYSLSFQFSAPRGFAACNLGTGRYPIANHAMPYLLDEGNRLTTDEETGTIAGLFFNRSDIEAVQHYLESSFPGLPIGNYMERGVTALPAP